MLAQQRRSHDTRERRPQGNHGRRINSSLLAGGERNFTATELATLQRVANRLMTDVQQFYHMQARRRESDAMFLARWGKAVRHG